MAPVGAVLAAEPASDAELLALWQDYAAMAPDRGLEDLRMAEYRGEASA